MKEDNVIGILFEFFNVAVLLYFPTIRIKAPCVGLFTTEWLFIQNTPLGVTKTDRGISFHNPLS